jgi:hypothetical protein
MANQTDLLPIFTDLLAYAGDENAMNGYSGTPRTEPLVDLSEFVANVKKILLMPADISSKVFVLKGVFDRANEDDKQELINYIDEYEVNPMRGGRRSRKTKRNKRKTRRV